MLYREPVKFDLVHSPAIRQMTLAMAKESIQTQQTRTVSPPESLTAVAQIILTPHCPVLVLVKATRLRQHSHRSNTIHLGLHQKVRKLHITNKKFTI